MYCTMPGFPVHHQLPELTQTHVPWVGDAIQPLPSSVILFCLQSFPASGTFQMSQFFPIRWPKYWSFSFSISPSNEYSGLISFRIDWFDLLAVQGTLKSLLQHHSSKASILWLTAFFLVQLLHLYMTTGKTIALTGHTFVGKVMFLLSNMLSMLVITSNLQVSFSFMAVVTKCAVILEPKKTVCHCSHCFPIYLPRSDGTGCHDLSFLNVEF